MNIKSDSNLFAKLKLLNKYDLVIFLIPFLIFLYFLHVFDPGLIGYDAYNQLHQIATGKFTNWHPFLHTFIEMICLKIYTNTVSIAILQIITFSTMWMIICKYNRNDAQKSKKNLILQIIITLVISLIPINAMLSISLLKDVLFSYFLMFLCFLFKVMIDRHGKISFPFVVLLSIVMALVGQIRLNGMYIVLPLLVVLAIYLYRKDKANKAFVMIPALTIVLIILISSLTIVYDVDGHQLDGVRDVVAHMLADYDMHLNLDPADKEKLHVLINETQMKSTYIDTFKDPLRNATDYKVWKNDKATYIKMAIKYSLKNPGYFIHHMLNAAPITWKIVREDSWQNSEVKIYITPDQMESAKDKFYSIKKTQPKSNFDAATPTNMGTPEFNILNSWVNFAKDNAILSNLFNSPALYMYLSLILMVGLYFITRVKDIWLVFLPNLLNIITIFISVPAQQNRYLYPNLLVFYMLVIILIGILMKSKSESDPTSIIN